MKTTPVAAAVLLREDGRFLLGQRAPGTFYAGYWEFPGGKVEAGESPHAALVRELREELGIEVLTAHPWLVREHCYEHAHVRLHFFRVTRWQGALSDRVHSALVWESAQAPTVQPLLPANGPVLAALALPALYGISHAWRIGTDQQLSLLETALTQGLELVQLREACLPSAARESFVARAVALCHHHGARVLINGDAELARASGADGVHLPAAQLMALHRRPPFPLVAASCHERHELEHAARLGLDFAVLGPVLPTASHPGHAGIGWQRFAQWVANLPLPVYAIGGLTSADLPAAYAAGAHGIAAIRAAWAAPTD